MQRAILILGLLLISSVAAKAQGFFGPPARELGPTFPRCYSGYIAGCKEQPPMQKPAGTKQRKRKVT
jgi:hypothetical protein